MGANKVDFCLGDGSHPDLVKRTREESGKGAGKEHIAAPCLHANGHSHHVLLGDEALNESVGESLLVGEGKSGVLCVSVHSLDAVVRLAQVHEAIAICHTRGHLGWGGRGGVPSVQ